MASFDRCWGGQGAWEDPEDPEACCQGVLVGREASVVVQGVLATAVTYTNAMKKRRSKHMQVAEFLLPYINVAYDTFQRNPWKLSSAKLRCDHVISARALQTLQLSTLFSDPIINNAHPHSAPHKG